MNSLLQLRRTPLRSLLGLLLLALAAALLCVTLGQGYAAGRARQTVEDSYHTVALPTDKYKKQQLLDEEGNVLGVTYFEHQPPAVQEFLSTLKDNAPTMVKEDCYHRFASAVIADVTPFNIMSSYIPIPSTGGYGTHLRAQPNTGAALVFRLEEIG